MISSSLKASSAWAKLNASFAWFSSVDAVSSSSLYWDWRLSRAVCLTPNSASSSKAASFAWLSSDVAASSWTSRLVLAAVLSIVAWLKANSRVSYSCCLNTRSAWAVARFSFAWLSSNEAVSRSWLYSICKLSSWCFLACRSAVAAFRAVCSASISAISGLSVGGTLSSANV